MVTELLVALSGVFLFLAVFVTAALIGLIVWHPRGWVGRLLFYGGTVGLPIAVVVLATTGAFSMLLTFFVSLNAVFAGTIGFLAIGLRGVGSSIEAHRRRLRTDTVLYLVSSVLWFAALYWSATSTSIEGLHFAVASPATNAAAPSCAGDPRLICTPLTFIQALQFSAGNLLTLGAAGITPLDDAARLFAVLQLLPVFTSVYVLARN